MHRVITKSTDRYGHLMIEPGPWLPSLRDAEQWAGTLRSMGYQTAVESQGLQGDHEDKDKDLAKALAGMA